MMRKRYLWTLLLSIAAIQMIQAGRVTEQEARVQAERLFSQKGSTRSGQMLFSRVDLQLNGAEGNEIYVFNREGGGFAVVSGDDRTAAVLGFSETGALSADRLPSNLRWWLESYVHQITQLGHVAFTRSAGTRAIQKEEILPKLKTKWGQDEPYNLHTPELKVEWDGQTKTVNAATGCVATAMAQVMNYYRYPEATLKYIAAMDSVTKVPVGYKDGVVRDSVDVAWHADAIPARTKIDWANIVDEYNSKSTDNQKEAVARLMQYCGGAARMNYGISSGANILNMLIALYDTFGYGDANLRFGAEFNDTQDFAKTLYEELAKAGPCIFGGQADIEPEKNGAHVFVVDGYRYQDGHDYFHVNWGWNGNDNGYFLLDAMGTDRMKSEDGRQFGFNNVQHFVGGMGAEGRSQTNYAPVLYTFGMSIGERGKQYTRIGLGATFDIPVYFMEFYNMSQCSMTVVPALVVYNAAGEVVYTLTFSYDDGVTFPLMTGYQIYNNGEDDLLPIGNFLFDGVYTLRLVCKSPNDTEWRPMVNAYNCSVTMTVSGNTATFEDTPAAIGGVSISPQEQQSADEWYNLQGIRLKGHPSRKGLYINGGRIRAL